MKKERKTTIKELCPSLQGDLENVQGYKYFVEYVYVCMDFMN